MKFILPLLLIAGISYGQWSPEMDSLARVTEKEFCLPSGTCRAFALQESNYNPYAERVEANYVERTGSYARSIRKAALKFSKEHNYQPSFLTEVYQMGKSVTLYQIMGINVRAMGYEEPYTNHIPLNAQFVLFGTFLGKLLKKHKGNLGHAASEYNGGFGAVRNGNYRNAPYVRNILKYQKQFSLN